MDAGDPAITPNPAPLFGIPPKPPGACLRLSCSSVLCVIAQYKSRRASRSGALAGLIWSLGTKNWVRPRLSASSLRGVPRFQV